CSLNFTLQNLGNFFSSVMDDSSWNLVFMNFQGCFTVQLSMSCAVSSLTASLVYQTFPDMSSTFFDFFRYFFVVKKEAAASLRQPLIMFHLPGTVLRKIQ
ncbi:hypothetical protein AALA00_03440, partial [Lachnospiraceae bacterium 46-15]